MEWPTPFVVLVDAREPARVVPLREPACDLDRRGDELHNQLQAARLTETSEVMLVIQRADTQGERLPTLWADLTPHARGAADQRRRAGAATESQVREALVRGAAVGLEGWLAYCRRPGLTFPDLPYTCCRVIDVTLEIQLFDS